MKTIIAERLRELRGQTSLREMAEAIGIKYSAWARYEAGGSLPGADILARICRVHDCSADWLLGLRTPPRPVRVTAIDAGDHAVVTIGDKSRTRVRVTSAAHGDMPACSKCPHLKKLKKLEALLSK